MAAVVVVVVVVLVVVVVVFVYFSRCRGPACSSRCFLPLCPEKVNAVCVCVFYADFALGLFVNWMTALASGKESHSASQRERKTASKIRETL